MMWLEKNWERLLFFVAGISLFAFGFYFLVLSNVTAAATTFGISIFFFIYSNVARFKRFKGLGFEAELWEDKQKEAVLLIEKLKGIIGIYSDQILMEKVKAGRWGASSNWQDNWTLFDRLTGEYGELELPNDLLETKEKMITYFIFDIVSRQCGGVGEKINTARTNALAIIRTEFGSPITDAEGHGKRMAQLRDIPTELGDLFVFARDRLLCSTMLDFIEKSGAGFDQAFGIKLGVPDEVIQILREIQVFEQSDEKEISSRLIELSCG